MKKMLSVLLSVIMVLALFAGCSSGTNPVSPSTTTSVTKKPTDPPSEKPVEKVKLEFWHYYTQTTQELISDFAEEYNASEEGMAIITEQYVPRDELLRRYTLGVVSGDLPDLGMVDNPDSASFAAMGLYTDITDRFNAWNDNAYQPGPLNSGKYDDKQYTLPIRSNCLALWVNNDMMSAAGIDNPPTTWDELVDASRKLLETNPSVYPLAISAIKNEEGTFQFLPFLQSTGATVNNLGSPEGIKAFEFVTSLFTNNYISPEAINWTQGDVQKQFAAGNTAMMINGPWQIPNMKIDAPELEFTVVYVPKDQVYSSSMGGENMGITSVAKDVDAAWDFMSKFLSTENNIGFAVPNGTISPHSNATAEMQYPNDSVMAVFIEQLAYAAPRGPHPKWPELSAAIQDAIQESVTGSKTPEAAAKGAAAKIAQINASIN